MLGNVMVELSENTSYLPSFCSPVGAEQGG